LPQHAHLHRMHFRLAGAFDERVVDGDAGRVEDQVDEDALVPRLVEPTLGRLLGPEARFGEHLQRALRVLRLDEEVEVVLGLRAAPRPDRNAAAQDEGHAGLARAFRNVDGTVDLVLLAGDLTTYGQPEQAALLAEICRPLEVPVYAVLGNHDWHCNQVPEIVALLSSAGVRVLDRSWALDEIDGASVGVVGLKGFIGGFPDSQLPDFGEPL